VDDSTRLRIATRIHFALLRHFGEHVEVGDLLKDEGVAREVLWVCEASDDREMVALARQFRHAKADARPTPKKAASVPQPMPWAGTSGFGVSRPLALDEEPSPPARWLRPSTWLKGRSTRSNG
jgi:hypothetical protein